MQIYDKDGIKFDLVESESASFDTSAGTMFSDGEVEITMGLQDGVAGGDPEPVGRLVRIHSSGVTFDTRATRASTDRKATFAFDAGDGEAVGAVYDADHPRTDAEERSEAQLARRESRRARRCMWRRAS